MRWIDAGGEKGNTRTFDVECSLYWAEPSLSVLLTDVLSHSCVDVHALNLCMSLRAPFAITRTGWRPES